MPEKLRAGSVFIDDGDVKLYLTVLLLSTLFFFGLHFMFDKIDQSQDSADGYKNMDNDARVWFITHRCSIFHHVINISFCIYVFYNSCSNGDGRPGPPKLGDTGSYSSYENSKHWGCFLDETCFLEPNKGYAIALFF